MSPMSWSSRKSETKRVCLPGWGGLLMSEGLAEWDKWCPGISRLSRPRTLVAPTKINIVARRAHCDRHVGGQPLAG